MRVNVNVCPTEPGPDHERAAVSRALLKRRAARAENSASLALLLVLA